MWMSRVPLEAEVWKTISGMKLRKAPDLDGFSVDFHKRYWRLITRDMTRVVTEFFNGRTGLQAHINSTLLTLIPKGREASCIQTISLSAV